MPRFKHYNDDQDATVVTNDRDQLGAFEYDLHYLVSEKLDLSAGNTISQPVK